MALNRPTFKVNVAANKKVTKRDTVFYDLKPDTTTRIRVQPPVTEDGRIFTKVVNHFKLKSEEGFGLALACLQQHGNDETGDDCYTCRLVSHLRSTGEKSDKAIAENLSASPRWYMVGWIYDKSDESYYGPKLIGLSKKTADQGNDILSAQEDTGDAYFCDPDEGQDLVIRRTGSGMNDTRYTVTTSGNRSSLDDVIPGWEDKLITDPLAACDLRVHGPDDHKRAVLRTFQDELDWEAIQDTVG